MTVVPASKPSLVKSSHEEHERLSINLKPGQLVKAETLALENLEFLGSGGNGSVFRMLIREGELRGLIVAVKFLETVEDEERVKRFDQEVKVLQQVNHPHIIKVLDTGKYSVRRERSHSIPFFVMEYQPRNLDRETKAHSKGLHPDAVLPICLQMASALVHIHGQNIAHGDLKPANILYDGSNIKVADFGIASLVDRSALVKSQGNKVGPHYYLSPEQWKWWKDENAERPGMKSDIFQLGLVFVKTLTGFNPNTVNEWSSHGGGEHVEPKSKLWSSYQGSLVNDIVGLARDMIEVDPNNRPSAGQVQDRLLGIFRAYSSHFSALYGVVPGREF